MRPKAYTGKHAPGRATVTLLDCMNASPPNKWYAAAEDGDSVLVVARGVDARFLAALVEQWGGEVQTVEAASDG